MSEFQYVAFRAVDAPVSAKNLEFMERQSSRAKITPWSFDNEYHFGDFRGNAAEMLHRGYDFHFHFANFGIRKLLMRFPYGLPDHRSAEPFFEAGGPRLIKDKSGNGVTLEISPLIENGELDDLWDIDDLVDELLPLRAEILSGDLRPLYLAHLAVATDGNHNPEKTVEAPVPAGLDNLTPAQNALAKVYGLDAVLLDAAAQGAPPLPEKTTAGESYAAWLALQPQNKKDAWLVQWLEEPCSPARAEMLADYRRASKVASWPTLVQGRTIATLREAASALEEAAKIKADKVAALKQKKRLAAMVKDPQKTLREAEKMVKVRGSKEYRQAAALLAELRTALAGTERAMLAEQQALKFKQAHPTLKLLIGALRKEGFLKK